ncbi:uncharacterized protein LAJ45_01197 [Morchella importuna]|uniref:uncharacterized protein n=1 Tax=Morchella importuna TaxID=1174673 RepID=UPI001E8CD6CC|nr:uncharacterized protein LAJ45_01197 [Morchella importuna]KAH8154668.1 hypothetical protein LAJ45_01197 [Morchella importuna]
MCYIDNGNNDDDDDDEEEESKAAYHEISTPVPQENLRKGARSMACKDNTRQRRYRAEGNQQHQQAEAEGPTSRETADKE